MICSSILNLLKYQLSKMESIVPSQAPKKKALNLSACLGWFGTGRRKVVNKRERESEMMNSSNNAHTVAIQICTFSMPRLKRATVAYVLGYCTGVYYSTEECVQQ